MKASNAAKQAVWQKTSYANLIRYQPSGKYFARLRVGGKLIRRCLKTTSIAVAKLRLADLEKAERQMAEHASGLAFMFSASRMTTRERAAGNEI